MCIVQKCFKKKLSMQCEHLYACQPLSKSPWPWLIKGNSNINPAYNNRWENANQHGRDKISSTLFSLVYKFLHRFWILRRAWKMKKGLERPRKLLAQETGGGFDLKKEKKTPEPLRHSEGNWVQVWMQIVYRSWVKI